MTAKQIGWTHMRVPTTTRQNYSIVARKVDPLRKTWDTLDAAVEAASKRRQNASGIVVAVPLMLDPDFPRHGETA